MELEETVASIFYIFLFAAFLTMVWAQSSWFKTTITGLDTLNEYKIDLVNDFTYSSCFVAKNRQGNDLLGVFDVELLNSKTEKKKLSSISGKQTNSDSDVRHTPSIDDCINTNDNYYYYEVWEKTTPNNYWLFGNSTLQGYILDYTWTEGYKPISIKRDNTISIGLIKYGFSKNPAKNGATISSAITVKSMKTACDYKGGIVCALGETCEGTNANWDNLMDSSFVGTIQTLASGTATSSNTPKILCCYGGGKCTKP